jgi:hypothetical protein
MPTTLSSTLLISLFDGIGESVTPTANFIPPAGDFSLSNLRNSKLFSRTRTPDLATNMQLTFDWGSAIEHNVFMLAGSNPTLSATRRIRDADNSGFTVGVVESGATLTPAYPSPLGFTYTAWAQPWGRVLVYVYPESVTKRYTRWHQSDTTNPDGFQEWGVARIGKAAQFEFQSWTSSHVNSGMLGAGVLRRHEITFSFATRAEAYDLQSLYLSTGGVKRVLVIPEPSNAPTHLHDAIWGVIDEEFSRETVAGTEYEDKRFNVVLVVREVSR